MISFDVKTDSKLSLPIVNVKESVDTPTTSFAELLKGIQPKKNEVENTSFMVALDSKEEIKKDTKTLGKKESFTTLLHNESKSFHKEVSEFNPQATKNMSHSEVKVLIADAKQYLKNKIILSDDFKISQVKTLPKTLDGLRDMAKTFGINMNKITLEEVKESVKPIVNAKALTQVKESKVHFALKESVKRVVNEKALIQEIATKPEVKELKVDLAPKESVKSVVNDKVLSQEIAIKPKIKESKVHLALKESVKLIVNDKALTQAIATKPEVKESKVDFAPKESVKQVVNDKALSQEIATKPEVKESKVDFAPKESVKPILNEKAITQEIATKPEVKESKVDLAPKESVKPIVNDKAITQEIPLKLEVKESLHHYNQKIESIKEIKGTLLFKTSQKIEVTTQHVVQTKDFKREEKTPKSRADDTLKLLLRGDKEKNNSLNRTADFSVATARVIAPSTIPEVSKSFDQPTSSGIVEESTSKLDGLSSLKADSFEVKMNEAKQMVKYLSHDVKTAIEDYKSPFTRIKVQLNPAKMGEVDVTVVQRGNNLHVNISSNTAAINTLAMNANELRTQLNTNGIQNASLNFNNSEQNTEQQTSQQQQNRQNERHANEEYNYYEKEEHNEEELSSLEIIVQNYA